MIRLTLTLALSRLRLCWAVRSLTRRNRLRLMWEIPGILRRCAKIARRAVP